MLVGGIAANFGGSYRLGGGREFVIEGDEYDSAFFDKTAKFLKYLPDIAIVNNIEFDHADIYPDIDAVSSRSSGSPCWCRATACCCSAPTARCAAALGGARASPVETFGPATGSDWQATDVQVPASRHDVQGAPHGQP